MALSANASYQFRNTRGMSVNSFTVATSAKIYQGSIVVQNASGTVQPASNDGTTTFVGLARAEATTGDGTITVEVLNDMEALLTLRTAITAAIAGNTAYAHDDNTITELTTRGAEIGTLSEFVSAESGWIKLGAKSLRSGAA